MSLGLDPLLPVSDNTKRRAEAQSQHQGVRGGRAATERLSTVVFALLYYRD